MDEPEATQADPSLVRVLVRAQALKAKLLQSGEASLTLRLAAWSFEITRGQQF